MKRRDLIKKLESIGFKFERNGANHDVYRRGNEEEMIPVFRRSTRKLPTFTFFSSADVAYYMPCYP